MNWWSLIIITINWFTNSFGNINNNLNDHHEDDDFGKNNNNDNKSKKITKLKIINFFCENKKFISLWYSGDRLSINNFMSD